MQSRQIPDGIWYMSTIVGSSRPQASCIMIYLVLSYFWSNKIIFSESLFQIIDIPLSKACTWIPWTRPCISGLLQNQRTDSKQTPRRVGILHISQQTESISPARHTNLQQLPRNFASAVLTSSVNPASIDRTNLTNAPSKPSWMIELNDSWARIW